MTNVNTVLIAGRLTKDVDLRELSTGTSVGSFSLAVNERYTTREGEEKEKTAFPNVEVWGRQAESCAERIGKGSPVLVEGKLESEFWEDRSTGDRRSRLIVRARRVHFLAAPGSSSAGSGESGGRGSLGRRADSRVRSGRGHSPVRSVDREQG